MYFHRSPRALDTKFQSAYAQGGHVQDTTGDAVPVSTAVTDQTIAATAADGTVLVDDRERLTSVIEHLPCPVTP